MAQHGSIQRVARPRALLAIAAAVVVSLSAPLSAGSVQGRVDPISSRTADQLSQGTDARVTGGGTVVATPGSATTISSFGLNARRPAGFTNGAAEGRINYDRHSSAPGRHVNAPVVLMEAELNPTPTVNATGGKALLAGDCNAAGSECRQGQQSVLVYVEDNGDAGGGIDVFRIFFCVVSPFLPDPTTFDPTMPPDNCTGPEGGVFIRTGNIQVRASTSSGSSTVPTAARAPIRLP